MSARRGLEDEQPSCLLFLSLSWCSLQISSPCSRSCQRITRSPAATLQRPRSLVGRRCEVLPSPWPTTTVVQGAWPHHYGRTGAELPITSGPSPVEAAYATCRRSGTLLLADEHRRAEENAVRGLRLILRGVAGPGLAVDGGCYQILPQVCSMRDQVTCPGMSAGSWLLRSHA
jgi:hypothetical protein